ncbi:hypothetical protein [Qipengyuania aurantiaca]|uniref:hypothetical protein n=1 Tax=Qipengyuania aurantiaca TaxID=2867233 RepID=UPI001FFC3F32|nr:hypothetical protein [Qipengyuania aurantiaca]
MVAKSPQVASARNRFIGDGRHEVLGRFTSIGIGFARFIENEIDFGQAEPGQFGVELKIDESL